MSKTRISLCELLPLIDDNRFEMQREDLLREVLSRTSFLAEEISCALDCLREATSEFGIGWAILHILLNADSSARLLEKGSVLLLQSPCKTALQDVLDFSKQLPESPSTEFGQAVAARIDSDCRKLGIGHALFALRTIIRRCEDQ